MIVRFQYKIPEYLKKSARSELILDYILGEKSKQIGVDICKVIQFTVKSEEKVDGMFISQIENNLFVLSEDDMRYMMKEIQMLVRIDGQEEFKAIKRKYDI